MSVLQDLHEARQARLARLGVVIPIEIRRELTLLRKENKRLSAEVASFDRRITALLDLNDELKSLNGILKQRISTAAQLTLRRIIAITADFYGYTIADLQSVTRTAGKVHARQVAAYLCSKHTKHSCLAIGHALNKDHTTVLHATEKITRLLETDEKLLSDIQQIEEIVGVPDESRTPGVGAQATRSGEHSARGEEAGGEQHQAADPTGTTEPTTTATTTT